jgi:hypothetical protein
MSVKTHAEKLRFLVSRRFPDHWKLGITETPNPHLEAVRQYETELASMPKLTLDERYIQAMEEHTREQEEAEERADRVEFFSQPDAAADFRFWCQLEEWSIDEAAALLLGKDPEKVRPSSLYNTRHGSPFRRGFQDLKAKLSRAVRDGKLQERDSPSNFFAWAERIGVPVPPELSARLEAGGGIPIEGRERASMLKLIIGMALTHYDYDPAVAKSPVPRQIADHLFAAGAGLNPETVRKFLQEASALLPPQTNKKELR